MVKTTFCEYCGKIHSWGGIDWTSRMLHVKCSKTIECLPREFRLKYLTYDTLTGDKKKNNFLT